MIYLIDTNICIYIMNNHPKEIIRKLKKVSVGDVGISTITVSELQFGVDNSLHRQKNQTRLNEFLSPFVILPYDQLAARVYGKTRFELEKMGTPIGPLDLLIAAHVVSRNLTLITNNDREFNRSLWDVVSYVELLKCSKFYLLPMY